MVLTRAFARTLVARLLALGMARRILDGARLARQRVLRTLFAFGFARPQAFDTLGLALPGRLAAFERIPVAFGTRYIELAIAGLANDLLSMTLETTQAIGGHPMQALGLVGAAIGQKPSRAVGPCHAAGSFVAGSHPTNVFEHLLGPLRILDGSGLGKSVVLGRRPGRQGKVQHQNGEQQRGTARARDRHERFRGTSWRASARRRISARRNHKRRTGMRSVYVSPSRATGPQVSAPAAPRRGASRYSRDCISTIRLTVRWNSADIAPAV